MDSEQGPPGQSESARLEALQRYRVLDTPAEAAFDDLTRLAAHLTGTPIALVSLVDATRQWFKSRIGVDVNETAREVSFCAHAIRGDGLFEVGDTLQDDRFAGNPLVTGTPEIRFYAGAPLATPEGHNLGTLCVIDRLPRSLTPEQRDSLQALARQVVSQLELRRALIESATAREALAAEAERRAVLDQARHRAERFMRESVDALQDHIAILDRTGTIVHVNRAWTDFARRNGRPEATHGLGPGANYLEVCRRAAGPRCNEAGAVADAIERAYRGPAAPGFSIEYPCHGPGEKRWFIVRVSPFGENGAEHVVVAHQDISERKAAEMEVHRLNETLETRVQARTAELATTYASLQASEARFRAIFENSAVGCVAAEPDGRVTDANAAFCAIAGLASSELIGMRVAALVHEEDRARLQDLRARMLSGETPGFVAELRHLRPDGGTMWVHTSVAAIHDADGRPVHTLALVQNITAHKQAEYERDRFFELSVDMLTIAGFDRRLRSVSPAWTRILGYEEAELIGLDTLALLHPDDRDRAQATLLKVAAMDSPVVPYLDMRMRTKSGTYRDIRWSAAAWASEQAFVAVGRDVTKYRAAEQNALRSERELRALAARLQSIREEERSRISREIHDELGQMLTVLKMDMTLLGRDLAASGGGPRRARMAEDLAGMVQLVDATLQSVRRIARQLRPEVLDALGLVSAIEWLASDTEARTGVRCSVQADPGLAAFDPEASTALFRIAQEALTNVVRHALNASSVVISLGQTNAGLELRVRDDGGGFDPGRDSAGASLGVLGMRERATSIGADFVIESQPGGGTTVTVRLPAGSEGEKGSAS